MARDVQTPSSARMMNQVKKLLLDAEAAFLPFLLADWGLVLSLNVM